MGFRFWRRIGIAPGVSLNLSRSGASVSFGPRGAKLTVGPGGRRVTVGLPGTGIHYTTTLPRGRRGQGARSRASSAGRAEERLRLGLLRRLVTPDEEEALVDGCQELLRRREAKALEHLARAVELPDGAFLAGCLALKRGRPEQAAAWLRRAVDGHRRLGKVLGRYGVQVTLGLAVTEEVQAQVGPGLRGALLALGEALQRAGRPEEALACLERLHRLEPEDVAVRLSLAELLWELRPGDRRALRRILRLSEGVPNASSVHTGLLLYRARAMRALGLPEAARELLTAALRRGSGRSKELLLALRYERALAYEALGEQRRARRDLERLYAEDPGYGDVAARLGL